MDVENLLPSMVSSDKQFPAFQPRMLDKQAIRSTDEKGEYVKILFTYDFLLSVSVFSELVADNTETVLFKTAR